MTFVLELNEEITRKIEERAAVQGVTPQQLLETVVEIAMDEKGNGPIDETKFRAAKEKVFTKYARAFEVLAEGAK